MLELFIRRCSAIQRRVKINRLKYNLAPDDKTEQESYICGLIGFCDKVNLYWIN